MRSRNVSAAALYQSCLVAMPASLPIARRSLASIAPLISASANSSTGWRWATKFAGKAESGKGCVLKVLSRRNDTRLAPGSKPVGFACARHACFLCKEWADSATFTEGFGGGKSSQNATSPNRGIDKRDRRRRSADVLFQRHQRPLPRCRRDSSSCRVQSYAECPFCPASRREGNKFRS